MTYTELIDRLFVEYGDETEKIHGEPVSLIYLIGQVGEKQGYNSMLCPEDVLDALQHSRCAVYSDSVASLMASTM